VQDADPPGELIVIEDHPLLRAALALALRGEGFVVHTAADTPTALDLLSEHPAVTAVVLETDLGPGRQNGFAFTDAARRLRPDIGIVFLTGRTDLLVGRSTGPREAHLVKPAAVPRIAAAVRRVAPAAHPPMN
jgi:CheY-like chemotaxis protein